MRNQKRGRKKLGRANSTKKRNCVSSFQFDRNVSRLKLSMDKSLTSEANSLLNNSNENNQHYTKMWKNYKSKNTVTVRRKHRKLFRPSRGNSFIRCIFLILCLLTNRGAETFNRDDCNQPLGMEDGRIPDDYITASSSYEMKSVGPQNGRLNKEYNGGAWCAKAQISGDKDKEYLEIRLPGGNHIITGAATQGRFGNGQGAEYVESYFIEYTRDNMDTWRTYQDATGHKELVGNRNTYVVAMTHLDLPFVASKVRFIPYSKHLRTVCMRVELYGCQAKQGVVSYWGDQGHYYEASNFTADLRDVSYDGNVSNVSISHGLGQLTDTLFGHDNLVLKAAEKKGGTRWVGWNRNTLNRSVILYFAFDDRKEFIDVNIQANNQKRRGIECYKKLEIFVSDNPNVYGDPLKADDALVDETDVKNMSTPMKHAVGQYVKLVLHFASDWILISEIQFDWVVPDTKPPIGNPKGNEQTKDTRDGVYKNTKIDTENEFGPEYNVDKTEFFDVNFNTTGPSLFHPGRNPKQESLFDNTIFKVMICVTLVLVIILVSASIYFFCKSRSKDRFLNKPINLKNARKSQLLTQAKMTDMVRAPTPPEIDELYAEPYRISGTSASSRQVPNCRAMEAYSTNSLHTCEFSSFHDNRGRINNMKAGMPYTISYSDSINEITKYGHFSDEHYSATSSTVQPDCLEELCIAGYLTTMKFPPTPPPQGTKRVKTICSSSIHKITNMGFHKMGPVYLCSMKDEDKGTSLSLMKNVWLGSSRRKRREFINEATWLGALRDTNVLSAIGMNEEIPASVFFPYSSLGDLPDYLRQRSKRMNGDIPDYEEIIIYLRQIASGMKYLEAMNIVHCDLAARNCTIWHNLVVKISNHANYCSKYKPDYYVHQAKQRLPIRWLSWEALLMGKWSFQSDVWAFGVTLWEIYTMCNKQPFDELKNHEIYENAVRWKNNSTTRRIPSPPASLPRELKTIFNSCLQKAPHDRPSFEEIHRMLMEIDSNNLNKNYCF